MRYLASIAGVFNYALSLKLITESPVDALRRQLSRQKRTKKGRAAEQSYANPIDSPEALTRLVSEARDEGLAPYAFTLCLSDAGLGGGEVAARRWRSIAWGSEDDPRGHVHITKPRSRDSDIDEAPKSGRSRRVQLSRRLRAALVELFKSEKPSS